MDIKYDLRNFPLKIKTDIEVGSLDEVKIRFFTAEDRHAAGGVYLKFSGPLKFKLSACRSFWTEFPTGPPSDPEKIWRITVTKTVGGVRNVIIHCNEVEVLNVFISETFCNDSRWERWHKDAGRIRFIDDDRATDFYWDFQAISSSFGEYCVLHEFERIHLRSY